jgi:hypothetical protein
MENGILKSLQKQKSYSKLMEKLFTGLTTKPATSYKVVANNTTNLWCLFWAKKRLISESLFPI